jgi:diguanylate cyclase (GGDEF)-like protein
MAADPIGLVMRHLEHVVPRSVDSSRLDHVDVAAGTSARAPRPPAGAAWSRLQSALSGVRPWTLSARAGVSAVVLLYCAAVALAGAHRGLVASLGLGVGQAGCGLFLLLRQRDRRAGMTRVWRLCGLGALSSGALSVVWTYYAVRFGGLPPVPSMADLFFVTSVLLLVGAALSWPVVVRRRRERLRYVLDATVVTAALLLIAWELLIAPGLPPEGSRTWGMLLPLSYPALDLLGVGAALYALTNATPSTRAAAAWLLAGTVLVSTGDALFALLLASGRWDYDLATCVLWLAAFVALVAARLAPEAPTPRAASRRGRSALPWASVLLPILPVAAALLVVIGQPPTPTSLVMGGCMVVLLMVRYALLGLTDSAILQDLERDARTDGAFLVAALQHLDQPVVACDADGRVRFFNRAFAVLQPQTTVGTDTTAAGAATGLFSEDGETAVAQDELPSARALRGENVSPRVFRVRPDADTERFVNWQARQIVAPEGHLLGAVSVGRDVTEERTSQAQLLRRATTDELTGLANRAGFADELAECERDCETYAVMLLDLDDFKIVNDSLGHHVGDQLLTEVATRVLAVLRPGDRSARLGGDEFVLLVRDADAELAQLIANRLLASFDEPFWAEGHELTVSASIGLALRDPEAPRNLLGAADMAMYLAKRRGKGGIAVFEPRMQQAAQDRLGLENDLRRAVRNEELHLAYQPVVDLATGALAGVEALVRWDDPLRGPVSPAEFIPIAEDTGLILPLGAWVLRESVAQLQRWDRQAPQSDLVMNVNVSTRQLERPGLLALVDELIAEGLEPSRLVLEITETALTLDGEAAADTLHHLRARGVQLAVDDFGTGYSSLSRLQAAPVSQLKIDRTFVNEIQTAASFVPIIHATLAMADGLGLGVIAEGIETPAQLQYLRRLGCGHAQGYLLARPQDVQGISALLGGVFPWAEMLGAATDVADLDQFAEPDAALAAVGEEARDLHASQVVQAAEAIAAAAAAEVAADAAATAQAAVTAACTAALLASQKAERVAAQAADAAAEAARILAAVYDRRLPQQRWDATTPLNELVAGDGYTAEDAARDVASSRTAEAAACAVLKVAAQVESVAAAAAAASASAAGLIELRLAEDAVVAASTLARITPQPAAAGHGLEQRPARAVRPDMLQTSSGDDTAARGEGFATGRAGRQPSAVNPDTDLMIYQMKLSGASSSTIAARLNQLGERTPLGVRWHATSVQARHLLGLGRHPRS